MNVFNIWKMYFYKMYIKNIYILGLTCFGSVELQFICLFLEHLKLENPNSWALFTFYNVPKQIFKKKNKKIINQVKCEFPWRNLQVGLMGLYL